MYDLSVRMDDTMQCNSNFAYLSLDVILLDFLGHVRAVYIFLDINVMLFILMLRMLSSAKEHCEV